ncbi:uncharacterized protein [Elaeis guineensis]|uniref:uncharacterized protein isoform X2 n=1 Tax=Elaeis guineensis var. tenera TaxID=51953 RepID=UPI003C6D0C34
MQLLPFVSRALPLPLPLPPSNSFKSGLSPNTLAQRRNTSTSGGLPPGVPFNLLGFSLTPPSTKGKPALLWNRKLPSSHHWIPGNQMVHGLDRPGSLSDLTHCTVACILECFFWVVYARRWTYGFCALCKASRFMLQWRIILRISWFLPKYLAEKGIFWIRHLVKRR